MPPQPASFARSFNRCDPQWGTAVTTCTDPRCTTCAGPVQCRADETRRASGEHQAKVTSDPSPAGPLTRSSGLYLRARWQHPGRRKPLRPCATITMETLQAVARAPLALATDIFSLQTINPRGSFLGTGSRLTPLPGLWLCPC